MVSLFGEAVPIVGLPARTARLVGLRGWAYYHNVILFNEKIFQLMRCNNIVLPLSMVILYQKCVLSYDSVPVFLILSELVIITLAFIFESLSVK